MACFLVPASEAVITTIAQKVIRSKENKNDTDIVKDVPKVHFSEKLGWLNKMLWGGSALLAFEHLWHGEIVPFFPFLTAASDPSEMQEVLHEMATSGVGMAVLVTAVWGVMVFVSSHLERKVNAGTINSVN